ncbi:hypothetical protein DBB36_15610 [Flavobacterium sp. WLB]|nr:hypothetical protein DBB36_15610 [Flavobacterium sp. WLB]
MKERTFKNLGKKRIKSGQILDLKDAFKKLMYAKTKLKMVRFYFLGENNILFSIIFRFIKSKQMIINNKFIHSLF